MQTELRRLCRIGPRLCRGRAGTPLVVVSHGARRQLYGQRIGAERAAIVWQAPVRSQGGQLEVPHTTVNFPAFQEAVQHFMTIVPSDERKFSKIVTAAGELWLVSDIEQIFDSGAGDLRAFRPSIGDEAAIPPIPPDEPYDGSPV